MSPVRQLQAKTHVKASVGKGAGQIIETENRRGTYRERYAELIGEDVTKNEGEFEYVTPARKTTYVDEVTQAPVSNVSIQPYEVNQRYKKDFSTFTSNQQKHHRRYFFFGDFETGKTSLWLRYIFYDQKRADLAVSQTPNKDGYIYTKNLADSNTDYQMEVWDFLTPLEARQCLNLKIENPEHARYDARTINKDYICGADVAVMVYDVMKPHTLEWCKSEAKLLASWGVKKIVFAGNKSDGDSEIDLDEANEWFTENGVLNFFVCATNNVGTQELFVEMDRLDDHEGGSVYTLNCLLGHPTDHARTIFAEEQEIACMQLAWLSFRSEMKYYENKQEKDSYWIRSDLNDKLARDIDRQH